MELRRANAEDIDLLVALRLGFFDEVEPMLPTTRATLEKALRAFFEAQMPTAENLVALLGEEDGQVIACGMLTVAERPPKPYNLTGRSGYLYNIHVQPAYRRRGYARQMVAALVEAAKALGAGHVELTSTAGGLPLYENLGFGYCHETYLELFLEGSGHDEHTQGR